MNHQARIYSVWILGALFCLTVAPFVHADQTPVRPRSCKFSRQALEAKIEKYRRGETPFVDDKSVFMFCREARPVLKKYNIDPDKMIREVVAYFLGFTNSRFNLELLITQIEKYPLESRFAVQRLSYYYCKDLKHVKAKKWMALGDSLIGRVRHREDHVGSLEFYWLGCLAQKVPQAKEFLEEVRRPSYPTKVEERDRKWMLLSIDYALAECGHQDAVDRLLAHIDMIDKQDDSRDIYATLLEKIPRISNRILLKRLSPFIKDRRGTEQVNQEKQALRIGDLAVSLFTDTLGSKVTGERDPDWRPHSDEELDRVFQRVVSYLEKK